jgi:hypothetical protein
MRQSIHIALVVTLIAAAVVNIALDSARSPPDDDTIAARHPLGLLTCTDVSDCSFEGQCVNASCVCSRYFTTFDCTDTECCYRRPDRGVAFALDIIFYFGGEFYLGRTGYACGKLVFLVFALAVEIWARRRFKNEIETNPIAMHPRTYHTMDISDDELQSAQKSLCHTNCVLILHLALSVTIVAWWIVDWARIAAGKRADHNGVNVGPWR